MSTISEELHTTSPPKTLQSMLDALDCVRQSPIRQGTVDMIVCRPAVGTRQVLEQAELDPVSGLIGDSWHSRAKVKRDCQLNLMNARVISLIAAQRELWQLAGDQFFVDLDLSKANAPAGTRLQIGSAVIEITAEPHLGCQKFAQRFGRDAVTLVNSDTGKSLNLRGVNARVVQAGVVKTGDAVRKI
jgi:hypothetical protein